MAVTSLKEVEVSTRGRPHCRPEWPAASVFEADAPAKDSGGTLPTANLRSTYAIFVACRAPPRRAQSFAGASGFRRCEVTAEIQDATESLKSAQLNTCDSSVE
jgi:hypothetical protein